jgi:hypothetical protein
MEGISHPRGNLMTCGHAFGGFETAGHILMKRVCFLIAAIAFAVLPAGGAKPGP